MSRLLMLLSLLKLLGSMMKPRQPKLPGRWTVRRLMLVRIVRLVHLMMIISKKQDFGAAELTKNRIV